MDAHAPLPDLTPAILARTSGSPCVRLRELACDYVDGHLEAGSRALVAGHLAHCSACAGLVGALQEAQVVLPALAGADPGPWFTAQVLRATVKAPTPTNIWMRLMHRPRIALETAFLGTAAGLVGMALPLPQAVRTLPPPAVVQRVEAVVHGAATRASRTEQHLSERADQAFRSQVRQARELKSRLVARLRGWIRPGDDNPSSRSANP